MRCSTRPRALDRHGLAAQVGRLGDTLGVALAGPSRPGRSPCRATASATARRFSETYRPVQTMSQRPAVRSGMSASKPVLWTSSVRPSLRCDGARGIDIETDGLRRVGDVGGREVLHGRVLDVHAVDEDARREQRRGRSDGALRSRLVREPTGSGPVVMPAVDATSAARQQQATRGHGAMVHLDLSSRAPHLACGAPPRRAGPPATRSRRPRPRRPACTMAADVQRKERPART